MCIQGACEHRRAAAHPTQCGGSSYKPHAPGASSLALALTHSPHRQEIWGEGLQLRGSICPAIACAPGHPSPAKLGLISGPPARHSQESATQPLHHQGVTHWLMKSHSPLQNETNQSKTKQTKKNRRNQRKVVVLGKRLAAYSFASKHCFAQNVSIFSQNAIELSLK